MSSVRLSHVNKTFDKGVVAVSGFDLYIESGEFVVIVGPSGCGKSTVLRMIAGLEDASAGDIFIGGERVNGIPPGDRDVAMVFQDYTLYPDMTVRENLAFGLKLRKFGKEEIDKRVTEAAESLNITKFLDRLPSDLSGGEKQRIALGRVIVRRPKVFLLDEPMSGVDAKFRSQMRAEIVRLHKETGITFVYVTHDQTEAMTMGDRIVVMDGGRIVQTDTPAVLYDYPASVFTATFIGMPQMNMIPAVLSNGHIKLGDTSIKLLDSVKDGLFCDTESERDIYIGVRPEDIKMDGGYECSVVLLEQLGDETILYLDAGFKHNIIAKTGADFTLKAGRQMNYGFDQKDMKIFDRASEYSLSGMPRYNIFPAETEDGSLEIFGYKPETGVLARNTGGAVAAGITPGGFVRGNGFEAEIISVNDYPGVAVCRAKVKKTGEIFIFKLKSGDDLAPGKTVQLGIKDECIALFDENGVRVSAGHITGGYEYITFMPKKGQKTFKGLITDMEVLDTEIIIELMIKGRRIAALAADIAENVFIGNKVKFAFTGK